MTMVWTQSYWIIRKHLSGTTTTKTKNDDDEDEDDDDDDNNNNNNDNCKNYRLKAVCQV